MLGIKKGRKKEEELRVERVTVQVSVKEKELIEERAKAEGLNVSDYIRMNCIYKKYNQIFGGMWVWIGQLFY